MAEKKKLIRVQTMSGSKSDGYTNTSMRFSLVVVDGNERRQAINAYTCREQFCTAIQHAVSRGDAIDFERTRLLIAQDPSDFKIFRDKLFTGKRMINAYEEAAGWKPKSKITTVKHSAYHNAWLLTGPGEWMKTPQLMSTITFFLRLASVYGPFEADTVEEAEATMKRLLKEAKAGKIQTRTSDLVSFLPHIWDSLKLVVVKSDEIFGDVKPKEAWHADPGYGFGFASGILNFVTNTPEYSKQAVAARRRFEKLNRKK